MIRSNYVAIDNVRVPFKYAAIEASWLNDIHEENDPRANPL